jgi:hypothetical protein
MNDKTKKRARAGSIIISINGKPYEVPDIYLFKSHDKKDVYLAGVRKEGYYTWISTVKFIEEERYEDVPFDLLEKFQKLRHRKVIIDNEEYDIPDNMYHECKGQLAKLSKYNIKGLKDLKELYKPFIFKNN